MLFDANSKLEEVFNRISRELVLAVTDATHPFRFVQLATFSGQGPDSRYVVLRDVDDSLGLYVFSDNRTSKVTHLAVHTEVALLFYNSSEQVQLRIKGKATVHHQNKVSKAYWPKIQGEVRKAYNSIIDPGEVIDKPSAAHQWKEDMNDTHFAVLQIQPLEMDILQLNGLSHIRARFARRGGDWEKNWLAP